MKKRDGRNSDLGSCLRSKSGISFENCTVQPYYFDKVLTCVQFQQKKYHLPQFFMLNDMISKRADFQYENNCLKGVITTYKLMEMEKKTSLPSIFPENLGY